MVNIVIVEKTGSCVDKHVNYLKLDDLYKKCNFRKSSDFEKIHTFKVKDHYVHVYGKVSGKANQENKFEFPPPIDTKLFFGNMALVKTNEETIEDTNMTDYSAGEWNADYETLMGGFEDIGSESSSESDELDNYSKEEKTKEGYLKDGFVVQDVNDSSADSDDELEESYQDSGNDEDNQYGSSYDSHDEGDDEDDDQDSELSEEDYDTE